MPSTRCARGWWIRFPPIEPRPGVALRRTAPSVDNEIGKRFGKGWDMPESRTFGEQAHHFCSLTGIDLPIVQAPMAGGWTTPELVAAVANAGGLGMIAAARVSTEGLRELLDATRARSDRPFGVNFLLAPPDPFDGGRSRLRPLLDEIRAELGLPPPDGAPRPEPPPLEEQLQLVLERGVKVVSFAMGDPSAHVETVHDAGGLVLAAATSVEEAKALDAAGVDVIVAQGAEAGGHRATFRVRHPQEPPLIGTLVLVPALADALDRPVLAAGGVMDGRGLAAALTLGACGVQMGTRFLLTPESGAFPDYRRRILAGGDTDTAITWRLTGRPARTLRNRLLTLLDDTGEDPLPWPHQAAAAIDIYRAAAARDDGDFAILLAGQGAPLARDTQPAAEMVAEIAAEAGRILGRFAHGDSDLGNSAG